MRNLFDFLRRQYFIFLFLFLEIISLVLLFNYNAYQNSSFAHFSSDMTGSLLDISSNISDYFSLREKNRMLSEDNARLHSILPGSFYKTDTNTFFFHDTVYKIEYKYISAKVISNTISQRNNFLMLSKGREQGIENHMGVIVGNRIVGQVVSVSEHFCWVMSVLNKDSRISGKFKKNNQLVNIEWNGGSYRIGDVKEIPKQTGIIANPILKAEPELLNRSISCAFFSIW